MTITLAVHPFVGQPLPVVRWLRVRGEPYVELLHPRGWTIRVPQEWTERARPAVVPEFEGRPVRLDLRGLVRLAAAVRQKLDKPGSDVTVAVAQKPDGKFEHSRQRPDADRKTSGSTRLGGRRSGSSSTSARRAGIAGAKNASKPTRRRRGGKR